MSRLRSRSPSKLPARSPRAFVPILAVAVTFALGLATTGCGPSGKLTGTVEVKNGNASGVTVTLTGAVTRAAAVDDSGAYTFDGLPDGVFVVEASAPSTLEGTLHARGTVASGTGTVDAISFRGAGRVSGRVTSPTGSSGAQVFVAGAPIVVNVAQDGTFALDTVPAGEATLVAVRDGYEPSYTKLTVPFAAALENQVLALTEVAHGSGQISGRAYYFDQATHEGISVKVEGTAITTQTDAQGQYTLRGVPLGYVTLVAEAPGYQPARAVNVLSASGGNLRADDLRLSFAERRFDGDVASTALSPTGKDLLFVGRGAFEDAYWLYRLELTGTGAPVRLLRVGPTARALSSWWRADGTRAAFRFDSEETLYAVDLATAQLDELTQKLFDGEVSLAGERVFFLEHGANFTSVLTVFDFGTRQVTSIEAVETPSGWCPPQWPNGRFVVSASGAAAYFAQPPNKPVQAHAWNGAVQDVSGGLLLDCLAYHGKGTQLLALHVPAAIGLYNLTSGAPVPLITPIAYTFQYPYVSFTGDDQSAWWVVNEAGVPTLRTVPVAGGATATLEASTTLGLSQVRVQPGGDQLAFRGPGSEVIVKHADGTLAKTYPPPSTGPSTPAYDFGPEGRHFAVVYLSDRIVWLADAQTHVPAAIGESASWSASLPSIVSWSPHERALSMVARLPSGDAQGQVIPMATAQPLDLPFLGAGLPGAIWSATDRYLLLADTAGDRIVDLDTGATRELQRSAKSFASGGPFFTGDEARLVFSEDGSGGGRVMAAHSDDGSRRVIGDGDTQTTLQPIRDSGRILGVDLSSAGEARGLYTIAVP